MAKRTTSTAGKAAGPLAKRRAALRLYLAGASAGLLLAVWGGLALQDHLASSPPAQPREVTEQTQPTATPGGSFSRQSTPQPRPSTRTRGS